MTLSSLVPHVYDVLPAQPPILTAVDGGQEVDFPRTAEALRDVLMTDPRCRRRWQRHVRRTTSTRLPNQAGVAWVLARALWDRGDVSECSRSLPRSLKDRVSRALGGRLISAGTLALFVEAFELSAQQEHALYAAWEADYLRLP